MSYKLPPPMTADQRAERLRLQAIDGAAARAEYDAKAAHEVDKIANLRAMRLERERLETEAAPAAPPPKAVSKSAKPKRRNIPFR